jgi:hypothetical protein
MHRSLIVESDQQRSELFLVLPKFLNMQDLGGKSCQILTRFSCPKVI